MQYHRVVLYLGALDKAIKTDKRGIVRTCNGSATDNGWRSYLCAMRQDDLVAQGDVTPTAQDHTVLQIGFMTNLGFTPYI